MSKYEYTSSSDSDSDENVESFENDGCCVICESDNINYPYTGQYQGGYYKKTKQTALLTCVGCSRCMHCYCLDICVPDDTENWLCDRCKESGNKCEISESDHPYDTLLTCGCSRCVHCLRIFVSDTENWFCDRCYSNEKSDSESDNDECDKKEIVWYSIAHDNFNGQINLNDGTRIEWQFSKYVRCCETFGAYVSKRSITEHDMMNNTLISYDINDRGEHKCELVFKTSVGNYIVVFYNVHNGYYSHSLSVQENGTPIFDKHL